MKKINATRAIRPALTVFKILMALIQVLLFFSSPPTHTMQMTAASMSSAIVSPSNSLYAQQTSTDIALVARPPPSSMFLGIELGPVNLFTVRTGDTQMPRPSLLAGLLFYTDRAKDIHALLTEYVSIDGELQKKFGERCLSALSDSKIVGVVRAQSNCMHYLSEFIVVDSYDSGTMHVMTIVANDMGHDIFASLKAGVLTEIIDHKRRLALDDVRGLDVRADLARLIYENKKMVGKLDPLYVPKKHAAQIDLFSESVRIYVRSVSDLVFGVVYDAVVLPSVQIGAGVVSGMREIHDRCILSAGMVIFILGLFAAVRLQKNKRIGQCPPQM